MNVIKKLFNNTGKPQGVLGKLMANSMNSGHAKVSDWGMSFLNGCNPQEIVELGCGGGRNAAMLLETYPKAVVAALDYSEVSVKKTAEINRAAVDSGRCCVVQGNVAQMPFESDRFDLATAFETVYFWPGPTQSFREVHRVIKPGGTFLIVNESDGTNQADEKWSGMIDNMRIYTAEQLCRFLKDAGFAETSVHRNEKEALAVHCGQKGMHMKPDYKNWVPKGMIFGVGAGFAVAAALLIIFAFVLDACALKAILLVTVGIVAAALLAVTIWLMILYNAFSYDGKRKLSKIIVEGIASWVHIPDGGKCLDVGCGSGALTIACAKRNPSAAIIGVDRWGKEYASYSKSLCESNAVAEGVFNVTFRQGNATKLDFPDESFDAATSNYVYHNIVGADKQDCLRETLRVLKKGGTFALHDMMMPMRYGDMQAFVQELKEAGYEKVELIDTANGMFMKKKEAMWLDLAGSMLLTGVK